MRGVGTRLSFLVVAWVMLTGGARWSEVAIVSAAQLAGYLVVFFLRRPLGVYADLGSVAALGAIAFYHDNVIVVGALAAVLGALCGVRAGRPGRPAPDSPPREGVIRGLLLVVGLAAGAAAMWLGPLGALWVNAVIFAVSAARQLTPSVSEAVAALPGHRFGSAESRRPTSTPVAPSDTSPPIVGRIALNLFATNLLAQAAAVVLVVVSIREVARAPELLGFTAAAFVLGMLGLTARHLVFAAGTLAGGAAVFLLGDRPPALLLVVVASFVTGAATASVDPLGSEQSRRSVNATEPRGDTSPPVETPLGRVRYLGIPLGTAAAAWSLSQVGLLAALGIAAGLYLVALLIPVLAFRDWRQLLPDPPVLVTEHGRLPGRLTVTLVYANGQWLVEVRKGRALLGSRHLVKSNEALNMLALLEVPGVAETVEKALTGDQVEAARQAERVRNELSELESKLSGLNDLAELNDLRKTSST